MSNVPEGDAKHRLRADLALAVIAFIWGATFITTKSALAYSSVILFLAMRFSLASIALAGVYLFQRQGWGGWRAVAGGTAAGTCLFAGYILQTIGLKYTTATKTGFITGLYVVVVPLLAACVYRTIPRRLEIAGVAIAGLGMALMTLPKDGWALERGDALVALSTIPYAAHLLLVVRFARWCSPVALGFYQAATGAAIGLVVYRWAEQPFVQWNSQLIGALLITGILATAAAFTLLSWAQRSTTATRAAVILTLEPLFAWLTSVAVAGEQLSLRSGGGAALILAGILLVELKPAARPEHPSP